MPRRRRLRMLLRNKGLDDNLLCFADDVTREWKTCVMEAAHSADDFGVEKENGVDTGYHLA
jgi:hypothetical protein